VVWPFVTSRERFRREAADWFAKLRGSDREQHRPDFTRWYHAASENREAFDRVSSLWQVAAGLQPSPVPASAGSRPRTRRLSTALAILAFLAFTGAASVLLLGHRPSASPDAELAAAFAAPAGAKRSVRLPDGSNVLLNPRSSISVHFTRAERRIILASGQARFTVAHGLRGFVVDAGNARVVAHGTVFDVIVSDRMTKVILLQGSVDVANRAATSRVAAPGTRLRPGESTSVPGILPSAAGAASLKVRPQMLEFDNSTLADAAAEANRHSVARIQVADPQAAGVRISGAFRPGDAEGFAAALEVAFDLRVERPGDGRLILHSRRLTGPH
jgi:transmembrane sensor